MAIQAAVIRTDPPTASAEGVSSKHTAGEIGRNTNYSNRPSRSSENSENSESEKRGRILFLIGKVLDMMTCQRMEKTIKKVNKMKSPMKSLSCQMMTMRLKNRHRHHRKRMFLMSANHFW
ncbi:unnamed protein product [Amoebophrya sp. A25]|nr:unnamed protein product [Amoebophrya sp. A25]|eukprot:GSA25T00004805001.1